MEELISVIVPVYMVEKYLNKCIDSIINQTYKNLEIILVDDGSKDNCGKICEEYKKKDDRIMVIHKENGGLSSARNLGIDNSNGSLITFIDSDDYISEDYIEYMYYKLKEYDLDIMITKLKLVYEKDNYIKKFKNNDEYTINIIDTTTALEYLWYQKNIDCSASGKLFKREVIKDTKFPEGRIYEDIATTYKFFMQSKRIGYTNIEKYYYLQRKGSILGNEFSKKNLDILDILNGINDFIIKEYPHLQNAIKSRIISANFYILRIIDKHKYKDDYILVKENIKKYRNDVFKDSNITLKTRLAIIISYINIDLVRYIHKLIRGLQYYG